MTANQDPPFCFCQKTATTHTSRVGSVIYECHQAHFTNTLAVPCRNSHSLSNDHEDDPTTSTPTVDQHGASNPTAYSPTLPVNPPIRTKALDHSPKCDHTSPPIESFQPELQTLAHVNDITMTSPNCKPESDTQCIHQNLVHTPGEVKATSTPNAFICGFHMHQDMWLLYQRLFLEAERLRTDSLLFCSKDVDDSDSTQLLAQQHHAIVLRHPALHSTIISLSNGSNCISHMTTVARWLKQSQSATSPASSEGNIPMNCFCGKPMQVTTIRAGLDAVEYYVCRYRRDGITGCSRTLPVRGTGFRLRKQEPKEKIGTQLAKAYDQAQSTSLNQPPAVMTKELKVETQDPLDGIDLQDINDPDVWQSIESKYKSQWTASSQGMVNDQKLWLPSSDEDAESSVQAGVDGWTATGQDLSHYLVQLQPAPALQGCVTVSQDEARATKAFDYNSGGRTLPFSRKMDSLSSDGRQLQRYLKRREWELEHRLHEMESKKEMIVTATAMFKDSIQRLRERNTKMRSIGLDNPDARCRDCKSGTLEHAVVPSLISRQFREMTRARIEGLIASFPKLTSSGQQHTTIETDHVRYVYQPLEDLFIVLITNKQSNILQDIDTLQLVSRVVSSVCRPTDAREIDRCAFELLSSFDEIISLGYRENVNLAQVGSISEMDSQEEKIQEMIEKNKEREAKEELKRRAKMLDLQRKEQRKNMGGMGGGGYGQGGMGGSYSQGGMGGGYGQSGMGGMGNSSYDQPTPSMDDNLSKFSNPTPKAPATKARGMQLGRKQNNTDLFESLRSEVEAEAPPAVQQHQARATQAVYSAPSEPAVHMESVHVHIEEKITMIANRDGGLENMEVKGDLMLRVSDPARSKISLSIRHLDDPSIQFKTHPNVNKVLFNDEKKIAFRDSSKEFPLNTPTGVLRWRFISKDESSIPLSINCWPSPAGDGSCDVNIEYQLENEEMTFNNVNIIIPLPHGFSPTVGEVDGEYLVDRQQGVLIWQLASISSENASGSLEFNCGGDDTEAFFPVSVQFESERLICDVEVLDVVQVSDGSSVPFSKQSILTPAEYSVV
ncbi:Coatomer subunit delta [Podila epigama]|nr:Coatomer subunit delta [Podila epigama]